MIKDQSSHKDGVKVMKSCLIFNVLCRYIAWFPKILDDTLWEKGNQKDAFETLGSKAGKVEDAADNQDRNVVDRYWLQKIQSSKLNALSLCEYTGRKKIKFNVISLQHLANP
jgi:hypothetical protein